MVDSEALESEGALTLKEISQIELKPPEKPIIQFPEIEITPEDIKNALFPSTRSYYSCDDELLKAYQLTKSSSVELESSKTPDFVKVSQING